MLTNPAGKQAKASALPKISSTYAQQHSAEQQARRRAATRRGQLAPKEPVQTTFHLIASQNSGVWTGGTPEMWLRAAVARGHCPRHGPPHANAALMDTVFPLRRRSAETKPAGHQASCLSTSVVCPGTLIQSLPSCECSTPSALVRAPSQPPYAASCAPWPPALARPELAMAGKVRATSRASR